MPPHQRRATIGDLVCPNDPERGQRAIDALIEGAFVAEDERGCLHLRPGHPGRAMDPRRDCDDKHEEPLINQGRVRRLSDGGRV
jgi:hypothetical protein